MTKSILITGATGNLGSKLRSHFSMTGAYELRLLCLNRSRDPAVIAADLSIYGEGWAQQFADVDAVIDLAGDSGPGSFWASIQSFNIDLTLNVFEAPRRHARRGYRPTFPAWVPITGKLLC